MIDLSLDLSADTLDIPSPRRAPGFPFRWPEAGRIHLLATPFKSPSTLTDTWTSKVPKIMAFIPKVDDVWGILLGTLEVQVHLVDGN